MVTNEDARWSIAIKCTPIPNLHQTIITTTKDDIWVKSVSEADWVDLVGVGHIYTGRHAIGHKVVHEKRGGLCAT